MPKKQNKQYPDKRDENQDQWVMFLPNSCVTTDGDSKPTMRKLRHPKTGDGAMFLFTADNSRIYEVISFDEKFRSWFIGDTVQSDGSIVLPTSVDVIFLVLPYLIQAAKSGKFMQIEQIIDDDQYPDCNSLCACDGLQHLGQVCEMKGSDDMKVYRYVNEKALSWLKAKVERLAAVLKERKIQTSLSSSCTSTYVKSSKSTAASSEEILYYAHGMISEYLPSTLSKDLQEFMGIKEIVVHEKPEIEEPNPKRSKTDITPTEDYSKQNGAANADSKKNTRLSISQKKLEKVDKSGMKNISSFFSPKPKK